MDVIDKAQPEEDPFEATYGNLIKRKMDESKQQRIQQSADEEEAARNASVLRYFFEEYAPLRKLRVKFPKEMTSYPWPNINMEWPKCKSKQTFVLRGGSAVAQAAGKTFSLLNADYRTKSGEAPIVGMLKYRCAGCFIQQRLFFFKVPASRDSIEKLGQDPKGRDKFFGRHQAACWRQASQ